MTRWGWIWLLWIVYFALAEGVAVLNSRPRDTFSAHLWAWMGAGWSWQRCVVLVFIGWLAFHLVVEGLRWRAA
jgi:hypothetical protein